jgi:hypothetical protein
MNNDPPLKRLKDTYPLKSGVPEGDQRKYRIHPMDLTP